MVQKGTVGVMIWVGYESRSIIYEVVGGRSSKSLKGFCSPV